MKIKRLLLVGAVVVLVAAAATTQNPMRQGYYFTDSGGNDATAGIVYTRDSSDNPVLDLQFTTSDTNALRWQGTGFTFYEDFDSIIVEGATDDTSEMTIEFADPTADLTYRFRDDGADTYEVLSIPDGDVTGGAFTFPAIGGDDAVTSSTDNVLLCQQVFLPAYLTVANIMVRAVVLADSGSDDTVAVAIYEDADAGTRLITSGASADQSSTANVTFDVTDTTLGPGFYRLCACAQDASGAVLHAATLDDESVDVLNAGTVTFGTGANSCAAGVPPTTTGALTTADDNVPVIKLSGS